MTYNTIRIRNLRARSKYEVLGTCNHAVRIHALKPHALRGIDLFTKLGRPNTAHKALLDKYLNGMLQGIQSSFQELGLDAPVPNACYVYTETANDLIILIFCFKLPGKIDLRVADLRYCFTEWAVNSNEAADLCEAFEMISGIAEQLGIIAIGTSYKVDEALGTFDVDILMNHCQEPLDKAYLLDNLDCLKEAKAEYIRQTTVVKSDFTSVSTRKTRTVRRAGAKAGIDPNDAVMSPSTGSEAASDEHGEEEAEETGTIGSETGDDTSSNKRNSQKSAKNTKSGGAK